MHSMPPRALLAPPTSNRLLASMTRSERALVERVAMPVPLARGDTLLAPDEEIRHVVFPEAGLVSLTVGSPGEPGGEAGLVGCEGLVGLPALLAGHAGAPFRAVVRIKGRGLRVDAAALAMLVQGSYHLRGLVQRYTLVSLSHAGCNAACNAAHTAEARAASWLLQVADRVGPGIAATQGAIAASLGVRRPTLNAVLAGLRESGLLRQVRGRIAIADRPGLEAVACSCYPRLRGTYERLLPGSFPASDTPQAAGPSGRSAAGRATPS